MASSNYDAIRIVRAEYGGYVAFHDNPSRGEYQLPLFAGDMGDLLDFIEETAFAVPQVEVSA